MSFPHLMASFPIESQVGRSVWRIALLPVHLSPETQRRVVLRGEGWDVNYFSSSETITRAPGLSYGSEVDHSPLGLCILVG